MEYVVKLDNVTPGYDFIGAVALENRCCNDRPVLITRTHGENIYSCQCECGLWCTTGRFTIDRAMREWQVMTDHYDEEQRERNERKWAEIYEQEYKVEWGYKGEQRNGGEKDVCEDNN